jgi:hypothetical protein
VTPMKLTHSPLSTTSIEHQHGGSVINANCVIAREALRAQLTARLIALLTSLRTFLIL